MVIDPATTKYLIKAHIKADGIIEKSDVVGAIFGQTEGLLGDELDLRELQRSARVGRIEVELESKNGKSEGVITLPTSLDKVETVILAAAFESIDRVGPCKATITSDQVEDVRVVRRKKVIERAKELLSQHQAAADKQQPLRRAAVPLEHTRCEDNADNPGGHDRAVGQQRHPCCCEISPIHNIPLSFWNSNPVYRQASGRPADAGASAAQSGRPRGRY